MKGPEELSVLGVKLHSLTLAEAADYVVSVPEAGRLRLVVTLSTEMVVRAQTDPEFRQVVEQADRVVPDGVALLWAARRCGCPLPERVAGIDLVREVARRLAARGEGLFLLGGVPGVAEAAGQKLRQTYPGLEIAGTHHGFFREEAPVVAAVAASGARVLLVGLGSPRQERFLLAHAGHLGVPVGIGVGGSLDVLAGRLPRAPAWMIRLGCEWLFRLLRQPRRLKRMPALPRFVVEVLRRGHRAVVRR